MGSTKWSCLVCKKLAEKDRKKGFVSKHLLMSMFWFDSEKEAIEHLKNKHPKQYKIAVLTGVKDVENRCKNCNQKMRWVEANYKGEGGFYTCHHTIGVVCKCGHRHKGHFDNKCMNCDCKKFVKRSVSTGRTNGK